MINVLVTTTYSRHEGCAISTTLIPASNFYEAQAIADKINNEETNPKARYAGYGQYALVIGSHPPEQKEE
jgi:hypothetical protein